MDEQTPSAPSSEAPPLPSAPLPSVGRPAAPAGAAALNPWQGLTNTFLLDSGLARPVRRPKGFPQLLRSNFRKGELRVDDKGLHISGQGTHPLHLVRIVSLIGWLMILFGTRIARIALNQSSLTPRQNFAVYIGIFLLSLAMYWGARVFNEWRRGPMQFSIPWGAVTELQVEPKQRWANLLYYGMPSSPKAKPPIYYVPIGNLPPAMMAALIDVIGHHAPSAVQHDVRVIDWWWVYRIVSWIFVAIVLLGVIPILWRALRH